MDHISLIIMASFYIIAGANHFRKPEFYLPMMPPYIPNHKLMVSASGVIEILLGLLLFIEPTRSAAAMGIILMLTAFFTVHIYMIQAKDSIFKRIPQFVLYIRIPIQIALIYWAYRLY